CTGTPTKTVACPVHTGFLGASSYAVPAGVLTWNTPWYWQIRVYNGFSYSSWLTFGSTTLMPQPGVTAHLDGASEGSEMPGVNPQPGNYATTVTDASVVVPGPALSLIRTYNSQDFRSNGMFGPGWFSPWDQKVLPDPDGSGNMLVTLPTGMVARFARDGTNYFPPFGKNLTLQLNMGDGSWTVRDSSGTRRTFYPDGRLASLIDVYDRTQTYTYDSNQHLTTVSDAVS